MESTPRESVNMPSSLDESCSEPESSDSISSELSSDSSEPTVSGYLELALKVSFASDEIFNANQLLKWHKAL